MGCSAPTPACLVGMNTCVECVLDAECATNNDGHDCLAANICGCNDNTDCTGIGPAMCNMGTGVCTP
jgi:hypothetical protein